MAKTYSDIYIVGHLLKNGGLSYFRSQIYDFPKWKLVKLDTAKLVIALENDRADKRMVAAYAKIIDELPAIIAVPDDRHGFVILDGNHRAAAAKSRGKKVLAFIPV